MDKDKIKPTEAFTKYIDPIFIIQNELMFVAPRKLDNRLIPMFSYRLESYRDEQELRAGMCVKLVEKIEKYLSYENTKNLYKKEMLQIASNYELDYVEADKWIKNLDKTLLSHAKLDYCFNNYLKEISLNNDISVLACLMAMYEKIIKIKKEKNFNEKIEGVTRSKWYKYVRDLP